MSKSRKGQSSFFVGSFKVAVLLMCFVTVFVLALTLGVFGDGVGGVAEADWNPTFANSAISVNGKSYSNNADLNTAIQTALHSTSKTATVKIDLSSPDIRGQLYAAAGKSTNGESSAREYWWNGASWNNGFGAEGSDSGSTTDVYVWLNLQIPSYITSFLTNSEYTVTANHTAAIYCRRKALTANQIMWGYSFESSGSAWTSLAWDTTKEGTTYFQGDGTGDDTKVRDANTTITLNSTDKYVHVGLQGNHQGSSFWAQSGGVQAANNVFTFTIKVKDNITDTAAPQATVNGDNSTLQSTLATDNGTYLNPDSGLYETIKNSAPRDNATIATGNVINMTEAAVRKDGIMMGNTPYSKMLTLDVKDRIDSSTSANRANTNSYSGVAGGSVNGVPIDVSYGNVVAGNFSYNGGTNNGYYSWTADPSRDSGTLTLYFKDNTGDSGVSVTLTDSGGKEETYTVKVAGIYDKASDMSGFDATLENQIGKNFTGLGWLYRNNLNPSFTGAGTATPRRCGTTPWSVLTPQKRRSAPPPRASGRTPKLFIPSATAQTGTSAERAPTEGSHSRRSSSTVSPPRAGRRDTTGRDITASRSST